MQKKKKGGKKKKGIEAQHMYPDEAVMEMQTDETSRDAAVVLEGGSDRLLHQGLHRRATLVVEPDLEAGAYGNCREERKDGKCRDGDEEGETLHVGTNGACSSCWFFCIGCLSLWVSWGII